MHSSTLRCPLLTDVPLSFYLSLPGWSRNFFFVSHDMVRLIREGKEIYSFNNIRSPLLCLTFKSYENILPFIQYLSSSLPPGNSSPGLQKSVKVLTISPCTWILKILRAFAILFYPSCNSIVTVISCIFLHL